MIEHLTSHYINLLNKLLQNPNQNVYLGYLTPLEYQKLLVWNQTKHAYPKTTIHQMFEESVVNTPDRIAIVYGHQQLSYETLNKKANQLAHYLIEQGVSLETPVAISMARCPDLIIGLLAVLKAGGIYVPLDPEYPRERLAYMLSDSGAKLLLTHISVKEKSYPTIIHN